MRLTKEHVVEELNLGAREQYGDDNEIIGDMRIDLFTIYFCEQSMTVFDDNDLEELADQIVADDIDQWTQYPAQLLLIPNGELTLRKQRKVRMTFWGRLVRWWTRKDSCKEFGPQWRVKQ